MKLKCVPWELDTLALSLGEVHPTLLDKDKILFNLSMMGRVARPPYPFLPCVTRGRSQSQAIKTLHVQRYHLVLFSQIILFLLLLHHRGQTNKPGREVKGRFKIFWKSIRFGSCKLPLFDHWAEIHFCIGFVVAFCTLKSIHVWRPCVASA